MSAEPLSSVAEGVTMDGRDHSTNTATQSLLPTPPVRMSMSAEPLSSVAEGATMDDHYSTDFTHITTEEHPVETTERTAVVIKVSDEPFVPKFLKGRHFQWDRIRGFLETAPKFTGNLTLPPQETPWTQHSSAVEQLRMFLSLHSP